MSRSERLLALLEHLRARRTPVTAQELAAAFAVSVRTIYRDLATLAGQGARIEGAAGLGYVLRPGFFLPPLMLDDLEADAIALGLRFVMRRADPALAGAAQAAGAKLAAIMPRHLDDRTRLNGLVVGPADAAKDMLEQARRAVKAERKVRLAYLDAEGLSSERTVWPVALGFFDGAEVLAAWCETREAFRHFRIDRIQALAVLETRPPVARRTLMARWRALEPGVQY